jgi:hypothetical protein
MGFFAFVVLLAVLMARTTSGQGRGRARGAELHWPEIQNSKGGVWGVSPQECRYFFATRLLSSYWPPLSKHLIPKCCHSIKRTEELNELKNYFG